MSLYYPQGAITLRIIWEDFGNKTNSKLQEVYSLPVVCRRVVVSINDYLQADTFSLEIDYKQFPFDPRSMRACGVTIHMENMERLMDEKNQLVQIVPDKTNKIFSGFADEESISFDDSRRSVKMEGRDFTGILLDRKYTKTDPLDLSKRLDVLIQSLLSELPETSKITVDNRTDETLPVISKFAPDFHPLGNLRNRQENESYWNVIADLASRAGVIIFIEIDKLVITKPSVLYNRKKAIQFIYGKNVQDLQYKRKLGRKKFFNIAVRSLNMNLKDNPVIIAEIPKDAKPDWVASTGIPAERVKIPVINTDGSKGEPRDAPIMGFLLPDIANKDALIERGQEIYEELSRQQIEGTLKTKEMEAMDGFQDCIDLLTIRNGTPVQVRIDQGDMDGITEVVNPNAEGRRKEKAIVATTAFLTQRCYPEKIAELLAQTLNNARMNAPFYTKAVQFTLDSEQGFSMKLDFINFIDLPKNLGGSR